MENIGKGYGLIQKVSQMIYVQISLNILGFHLFLLEKYERDGLEVLDNILNTV